MTSTPNLSHTITFLSCITPSSPSRAWHTAPHPYLPLLATATSGKIVLISSLTSFQVVSTITGGHKRSVRATAWKPGIKGDRESVLATGSFDATAGIWTARNGARRGGDSGAGMEENGADDEQDGEDEDADDWFKFAVVLEGHDSEIKSVAWSSHGTFLATCSRDKSVWIWESMHEGAGESYGSGGLGGGGDDENYETVAVLQEHEGDVKCVAWHPSDESCLASGSYDEMVRVWRSDADDEWSCVELLEGHDGTVWCVDWEPADVTSTSEKWDNIAKGTESLNGAENGEATVKESVKAVSGPRIISCSADCTIRVWARTPKAPRSLPAGGGLRIRSIIRSTSDEEEWTEQTQLPRRHERAIYAIAWSKNSRRVVSCGSDGKIVVYEEVRSHEQEHKNDDQNAADLNGDAMEGIENVVERKVAGTWKVIAELEGAHGVYEVNSVCWSRRHDKGRRTEEEEVIVSTGDDGEIKVWTLDEG